MNGAPQPTQGEPIPPGFREVRLAQGPTVSLVVVAGGAAWPAGSLDRLAGECGERGVELVAVETGDRPGAAGPGGLPGVQLVRLPGRPSPAALRQRGLAAAAGDIVLFAEAGEALAPGWLDARLGRWPARSASHLRGTVPPSDALTTASTPVLRS